MKTNIKQKEIGFDNEPFRLVADKERLIVHKEEPLTETINEDELFTSLN